MTARYPALFQWLQGVSITVAVIGFIFPSLLQTYALVLALPLILFGIPHGATDHLIFLNLNPQQREGTKMIQFYSYYLGLMALYALIWQVSPLVGLALFLVLSAYHFGQSNWNFVVLGRIAQTGLFLLWGSFVIAAPVLWHYAESRSILEAILRQALPIEAPHWIPGFLVVLGMANIGVLLLMYLRGTIAANTLAIELVNFAILGLLFLCTPLLIGFALYFAGWHSLSSIFDQISFFRKTQPQYNWRRYVLQVAPYTLVALLSMVGLWAFRQSVDINANLGFLFLGISLVTLPHMILIELLYHQR
jgi:Brp/Blh family beta-carotene 15,15'-monooxygenase